MFLPRLQARFGTDKLIHLRPCVSQPKKGDLSVTKDARKQLIEGLNEDLRGEFQAIIMYRLYASMVQGPYRQELRTFFTNEIPEELTHAQILADKIAALGGIPAAVPTPVEVVSDAKAMLEAALKAELATIDRYVKRRGQAEAAGEHGLAVEFDTLIAGSLTSASPSLRFCFEA
jgi:bacterioferritin